MNPASVSELALVVVTALGGGALGFLLVYWIWLRRFSSRVVELQDTVVALASALAPGLHKQERHEKPSFPSVSVPVPGGDDDLADLPPLSRPDGAMRMLVEGRGIEIVSADGREEIRIEETPDRPLSAQERDRIIAYLRCEGFLS